MGALWPVVLPSGSGRGRCDGAVPGGLFACRETSGALSKAERRVMAALPGRVTASIGDATLLEPKVSANRPWPVPGTCTARPTGGRAGVAAGQHGCGRRSGRRMCTAACAWTVRARGRRRWRACSAGRMWAGSSSTQSCMMRGDSRRPTLRVRPIPLPGTLGRWDLRAWWWVPPRCCSAGCWRDWALDDSWRRHRCWQWRPGGWAHSRPTENGTPG